MPPTHPPSVSLPLAIPPANAIAEAIERARVYMATGTITAADLRRLQEELRRLQAELHSAIVELELDAHRTLMAMRRATRQRVRMPADALPLRDVGGYALREGGGDGGQQDWSGVLLGGRGRDGRA